MSNHKGLLITITILTIFVLGVAYYPVERRSMKVQGYFWRMTADVAASHDFTGQGRKIPTGSLPTGMETKTDRTTCPTREDDCLGNPYQWFTFTTTYTEFVRQVSTYGYNQLPTTPMPVLAENEKIVEGSETLYMVIYFVDSSGYAYMWEPSDPEEFQSYSLIGEYVGQYNLFGFLLDID